MVCVLLLRGVNLGPTRRLPMADLRALLRQAGYGDVRTYLQSGNVVLDADSDSPEPVAATVAALIAKHFRFEVPIVARGAAELAAVVERNPLGAVADDPKRYQVSFLSAPLSRQVARRLVAAAVPPELVAIDGREIYAWHPNGIARSKLWNAVSGRLGVTATARNWATVSTLLELAGGR
ncbi:MAG: DUF1697 domain-containing protein [Solirubrobacteraceae bacterium]